MAMFLVVGCQTTQSKVETRPEVVKEVKVLPEEKEAEKPKLQKEKVTNPFENVDIPADQLVTSHKPVICGRADVMLERMEKRFGEVPIMVGEVGIQEGIEVNQFMATMTYNVKTGSYTFLEQMPIDKRLMCVVSSGYGKVNNVFLGTSL